MKKCKYCGENRKDNEFPVALTTSKKTYRRRECAFCYEDHKRKRNKEKRLWVIEYKKKSKCVKCGISDHRTLEFHHTENDKEFSIARYRDHGLEKIKLEIKKCELICANCHKIEHYIEV